MYQKPEVIPGGEVKPKMIPVAMVVAAVGAMLYGAVVTITGAALVNIKWAVTHTSVGVTSKKR